MENHKTVLESIALALLLIHVIFSMHVLLYVAVIVLFLTILDLKWMAQAARLWASGAAYVGTKIFQLVLLTLYFLIITPYSFFARAFIESTKFQTWGTEKKSNYHAREGAIARVQFEQPW